MRTFNQAALEVAELIDEWRPFFGNDIETLKSDHEYVSEYVFDLVDWGDLAATALAYGRDHIDPNMSAVDWVPTLVSKQRDYGTQNILKFGLQGIVVRSWDKIARIENLEKTQRDPDNESIADSVYDLVGYCILAIMLIRDEFELPLEDAMKLDD